jgi:hypothetical protein
MPATVAIFPKVICLTLPDQRERQLSVVQELEKVGIKNYEFFPGFTADAKEVRQAYEEGRVKRFPGCFRHQDANCGDNCGNPDCNNILLPVQVAVTLGFQAMLRIVEQSQEAYAAICEDDIIFAGYAKEVLASEKFQELIKSSGIEGQEPTLIRLTHPGIDKESFFSTEAPQFGDLSLTQEISMSNPFFLANRAFAKLAVEQLNTIDHTSDWVIHHIIQSTLGDKVRCLTLNLQLVADRSYGVGDLPSTIHPKEHHLSYLREHFGETAEQTVRESERLRNHMKHAERRRYCFIGSPRCGSHYVSAFFTNNGIDIGHERLGRDGICAWQFTVSSNNYPYIGDRQAQSDFFVHADEWFVFARNPISAIPSLIIENQKAPLSYAFRRDVIYAQTGVNLDGFASPIEKAARSYVHWYELALKRNPKAVLRVEHLSDDCRTHLKGHEFVEVEVSTEARGIGKPYLGIVHVPEPLAENWKENLSNQSLDLFDAMAKALGYQM